MKKRKAKPIIELLSVGEGRKEGPALRFAQALARMKRPGQVMAIDVEAPRYQTPANMSFIRQDALRFIEGMRSNSVRIVRDDFFVQVAMYGKGKESLRKQAETSDTILRISNAILSNPNHPNLAKFSPAEIKQFVDSRRSELKYIRNVKRVLIPGGRFALTTDAELAEGIRKILVQEGFRIASFRELKEQEIMKSGSPDTQRSFLEGERVFRIIAVKPIQQAQSGP